MTVWLTNTSTTAWLGLADTEATAGTVATAEICFCLAPGITTSLVSEVYESRKSPVSRSRAAPSCCSTVSGLYDSNAIVLSLAARTDSSRAVSLLRTELSIHFRYPAPNASRSAKAGSTPNANTRAHRMLRLGFSGAADSDVSSADSVGSSAVSTDSSVEVSSDSVSVGATV